MIIKVFFYIGLSKNTHLYKLLIICTKMTDLLQCSSPEVPLFKFYNFFILPFMPLLSRVFHKALPPISAHGFFDQGEGKANNSILYYRLQYYSRNIMNVSLYRVTWVCVSNESEMGSEWKKWDNETQQLIRIQELHKWGLTL